ncbi:hypothetical protein DFJ73DRAFT_934535 [Zopfochytrium polystomum]|nr:hypothetical protein DFJ73DRAFT_934535 [Zopfochytrium polystomum]
MARRPAPERFHQRDRPPSSTTTAQASCGATWAGRPARAKLLQPGTTPIARGQQVLANSRCGCLWNGFSTSEYATYPGIVHNPWESNLGFAPFSYAFDTAVPDSDYKKAKDLVPTLVDVVSKNGNFLIDFGAGPSPSPSATV